VTDPSLCNTPGSTCSSGLWRCGRRVPNAAHVVRLRGRADVVALNQQSRLAARRQALGHWCWISPEAGTTLSR
jgi:hypothetical protein